MCWPDITPSRDAGGPAPPGAGRRGAAVATTDSIALVASLCASCRGVDALHALKKQPMVLLDTAGPAPAGSSRAYLAETQVLPSLECGIEEMLRACTAAAEAGERVDPINFLATYLMRNNPRHSSAAVERLKRHARAKEVAAAKEAAAMERMLAAARASPLSIRGLLPLTHRWA